MSIRLVAQVPMAEMAHMEVAFHTQMVSMVVVVAVLATTVTVAAAVVERPAAALALVMVMAALELVAVARLVLFVSFGPEPLVHSHQQTQVIYNGTVYSNP
jgi:hypothetical protein